MCLEGKALRTDHERCGNSKSPQKANQSRGALEALHFFEIKRAGYIDRVADPPGAKDRSRLPYRAFPHPPVQTRKIVFRQNTFKEQEQQIRSQCQR
jgi:hypothetical protein